MTLLETYEYLLKINKSDEELTHLEHLATIGMSIIGIAGIVAKTPEELQWRHRSSLRELVDSWDLHEDLKYLFSTENTEKDAKFFSAMYRGEILKFKADARKISTYIIREIGTNNIKIGKSVDVKSRVNALRTTSGRDLEVLKIINEDIEAILHKKFSHLRTIGEWFVDNAKEIESQILSL